MSFDELYAARTEILPELAYAERLLLWAMRAWSAHHDDVTRIWWSLDRAFAGANIQTALTPFDAMMNAVFSGLHRWPDIRCVRCPSIGMDELRLLAVLAALQANKRSLAFDSLTFLIVPAAARRACDFGSRLALTLEGADLRFVLTH